MVPSAIEQARALYGCPYAVAVILGHLRKRAASEVRWVVWAHLRTRFSWTVTRIARAFSCNHTSILEGIAKAKARLDLWALVEAMAA